MPVYSFIRRQILYHKDKRDKQRLSIDFILYGLIFFYLMHTDGNTCLLACKARSLDTNTQYFKHDHVIEATSKHMNQYVLSILS